MPFEEDDDFDSSETEEAVEVLEPSEREKLGAALLTILSWVLRPPETRSAEWIDANYRNRVAERLCVMVLLFCPEATPFSTPRELQRKMGLNRRVFQKIKLSAENHMKAAREAGDVSRLVDGNTTRPTRGRRVDAPKV